MSFAARQVTTASASTLLVSLPTSIYVAGESTGTVFSSFTIDNSGSYSSVGLYSAPSGTWLLSGSASNYEVRLTLTSGTISGTTGTWLSLGTSRTWSNTANPGTGFYYVLREGIGTLEIRDSVTTAILASTTLTVHALSSNL